MPVEVECVAAVAHAACGMPWRCARAHEKSRPEKPDELGSFLSSWTSRHSNRDSPQVQVDRYAGPILRLDGFYVAPRE
jgi:hypothetical protein